MSAYLDVPVPLGFGRTMARPSAYLSLLAAADVKSGQRVLISGEASGYLAALLADVGAGGYDDRDEHRIVCGRFRIP